MIKFQYAALVVLTFLSSSLTPSFAQSKAAAAPPNVIVVLADDQGWGDLSLHGNPNLSTPNIDSLARKVPIWRIFMCARYVRQLELSF